MATESAREPRAPGTATAAVPLDPAAEPEALDSRPTPGLLQLAWPAVVGNLAYSLVGFVDIKIVGSLGPSAVAAVTTGNRMFFVVQALLMALTAGTTALVARAWGAGDQWGAHRVVNASVTLASLVALVLTLPTVLFAEALAAIFRLDAETVAQAADFIRTISFFNIAFALNMVLGAALRAAGDTMVPLLIGLFTNVVNVVLVYGLVYGAFGLPAWGVRGAALASGLAFTSGALLSVVLWIRGGLRIRVGEGGWLDRRRFGQLARIGYPSALEQAAMQLGFILFLWIVSTYGTAPYAAYGIGVTLLSFSFVVGFGFSIAASTHVGQRLGAKDPAGAAESGWHAMRMAVAIMIGIGGLITLAARPLAGFLIDDPEVVRLTVVFIYILGAVQPLMAIEFTIGGALRGAADTRFPLYTTLTGLVIVRGCVAAAFMVLGLSVEWVFAALIVDYIVKAIMLTLRFRSARWQHIVV